MRTTGSNQKKTLSAIRSASLDLIFKRGFESASLRTLSRKVGIHVGSLYNYFDTKEDLLVFIIQNSLEDRLGELNARLAEIDDDPQTALRVFVELSLRCHTYRRREMIIGTRDMHNLSSQNLKAVVALRDEYDTRLTEIVQAGQRAGVFKVADARIATFAIIGMLSGVSNWFRSNGRLSYEELLEMYLDYAFAIVGGRRPQGGDRTSEAPERHDAGSPE